jgi:hypothetical protein
MNPRLLPEEDALDDPDDDGEADLSLPGDLWFRHRFLNVSANALARGSASASYTRGRLRHRK